MISNLARGTDPDRMKGALYVLSYKDYRKYSFRFLSIVLLIEHSLLPVSRTGDTIWYTFHQYSPLRL